MTDLTGFIAHARRMEARCTREADEFAVADMHDVAETIRRQRDLWIQLATELEQHCASTADDQLDIPLDLEGVTA